MSARGWIAGPSCLTWQGKHPAGHREGIHVSFSALPSQSWEYEHEFSPNTRSAGPLRSHRVVENVADYKRRHQTRQNNAAYTQAMCIAGAMSLAGLHGSSLGCWPVAWFRGECAIFHPPACGTVEDAYVGSIALVDSFRAVRAVGIALLAPWWNHFIHFGDVPAEEEVQRSWQSGACFDKSLPALPSYQVVYHHGKDDCASDDCASDDAFALERASGPMLLAKDLTKDLQVESKDKTNDVLATTTTTCITTTTTTHDATVGDKANNDDSNNDSTIDDVVFDLMLPPICCFGTEATPSPSVAVPCSPSSGNNINTMGDETNLG